MGASFFDIFEPVSAKAWKQKIQFDLKGADYNEALITKTHEGLNIKPFYHLDEFEQIQVPTNKHSFAICQALYVDDEKTANFLAKDALKRGATAIEFEAGKAFDIEALMLGLDSLPIEALNFNLKFLQVDFLKAILKKTNTYRVYLNIDPIGYLASSGNWQQSKEADLGLVAKVLETSDKASTVLAVDAGLYQNAGATMVQQVAYALAHANEYIEAFKENIFSPDAKPRSIQFKFAVGSNYFFEIAKIRAFKSLFTLLCKEQQCQITPVIFVKPSLRNKTLYDYNNNMLRTTTECMSAILGGAQLVSNLAYDSVYHKKNEFGERIARNQLLILREESYLKEASTIVEGSYYIESITSQIAAKALKLFKELESSGGFLSQLNKGTIQRKIKESAAIEQKLFNENKMHLIGINKQPNLKDTMKNDIELYPFVKIKARQTQIEPIITSRLAGPIEQERLSKES